MAAKETKEGESEPPQSAVKKIDGFGAGAGVVQVSTVRSRRGARPKPREVTLFDRGRSTHK